MAAMAVGVAQAALIGNPNGYRYTNETCNNQYINAQAFCRATKCQNLSYLACNGDPDLKFCMDQKWDVYVQCRASASLMYPSMLSNLSDQSVGQFITPTELQIGANIQICWEYAGAPLSGAPLTVESVDLYFLPETQFMAQFAVDSLLSSVNVDYLGSATVDPPQTKGYPCTGWSLPLAPLSDAFQLNTTYRIIAQIRDSAAGPDSLDFVTELFAVKSGTSGVGDGSRLTPGAAKIAITAASPNPFNPTLELSFTNRAQADLDLEIYDISGKQVRVIHLGSTAAGDHTVRWSGGDNSGRQVSSGVYLMRVSDGQNYSQMTKVALVR